MSDTISGTVLSGVTLSSAQYADPVTIEGIISAAGGNALVAPLTWTIDVTGTIAAPNDGGVLLLAGGLFDNRGLATAAGDAVLSTSGRAFDIRNESGGILASASGDAVKLSGDVTGSTLVNAGLISAGNSGIGLELGAAVAVNAAGGVIEGGSAGVVLGNVASFDNFGTVAGPTGILVPIGQNYVGIVQGGLVSASSGPAISFVGGPVTTVTDTLTVLPGATFDGAAIGGQVADLVFGGTTAGTFVNPAKEFVQFSTISIAAGATWDLAGVSAISSPFQNDGTLLVKPGDAIDFGSAVSGSGVIDLAGGYVDFANTVAAGTTIDFTAPGSIMQFNQSHPFSGTVEGFASGDTIDITGFGASQQLSGTVAGDVLTLNNGLTPLYVTFATAPGPLAVEAIGGTNPKTFEVVVPCFRHGTRLLTPSGLRPVETLSEGDEVITLRGDVRRIAWHGRRRIDCRRHPAPESVLPVLVEKDAFGAGQPCRDLYLSPDHAIWIDGVLVEIKRLINGLSIRQVKVPTVTYHHAELESHDVVLAEMLPAETYLDCGNRHQFEDGDAVVSLFADFGHLARDPGRLYAPVVDGGRDLARIRAGLQYRLASRGIRQKAGTFRVVADGTTVAPVWSADRSRIYRLPPAPRNLTLVSTASRPAELDPASEDWRRLGIAICDVMMDGDPVDIVAPFFGGGFHGPEQAGEGWFRWTDGTATIAATGARELAFTVRAVAPVWDVPAPSCCVSAQHRA
jgi:hypothetical protein